MPFVILRSFRKLNLATKWVDVLKVFSHSWQILATQPWGPTHHTVETVERGRERGGRELPGWWAATLQKCQKTPHVRSPRYDPWACGISTHALMCWHNLLLGKTQMLFIVNSVRLHLTALKTGSQHITVTTCTSQETVLWLLITRVHIKSYCL